MAKAKKESTKAAGEPAKAKSATPAKKAATSPQSAAPQRAGPKAKKQAKSTASTGMPAIDTSLAARAAANMVANRDLLSSAKPRAGGEKRESGSFKQMKESLLKPTVQGPGGVLSPQAQQKKSNSGFGGRNQIGHNQTFGADVNRAGVPRRTGGG